MLTKYLDVLEVLANAGAGATVGQVEKALPHLTRGQASRILKELISINFVAVEKVAYRPGIDKNVYHMTENALSNMRHIVTRYKKTERQQTYAFGALVQFPDVSEI